MPEPSKTERVKPFLQLITAEEAYALIGRNVTVVETESIDVRDAVDRVLAEEVSAHDDVPHFFRSNMDGFAVRAEDTFGASDGSAVALRLTGNVAMGTEAVEPVEPGCTIRVSTGAMMPPGADAVVIVEHTETTDDARVLVRRSVVPRQYTVAIGEDMRSGDVLLEPGRRLRGSDIGAVCGVGNTSVSVRRRARLGIIATGDEIVEPDADLQPGQVRNINQYLLAAMSRRAGFTVNDYGVIGDDESVFARTLTEAVGACDVVFISGGSSMGTRDLTLAAIEELPGAEVIFHGVAIAPGKPTILARSGPTMLMGLPGNPASAAVVFSLFGTVLARAIEGEPVERILLTRPTVRARLAAPLRSTPGREDYVRARLETRDGTPFAVPLSGKSVAISTVARADGLVRIPLSIEGFDENVEVDVILL